MDSWSPFFHLGSFSCTCLNCDCKQSMLLGKPHQMLYSSYLSSTKSTNNILVIAEMSLLLQLLLLLFLSNCVTVQQSSLEEAVGYDLEETTNKSDKVTGIESKSEELTQRMERMEISWKLEKANLETKLETKNVEVENLQEQLKEVKVHFESRMEEVASLPSEMAMQIADLQNQLKEVKAQKKDQNQELADSEMKKQCKAEVKKELDKILPTAVEQGLRDLPFEMVCAYKHEQGPPANSVVSYDRITVEFNNSDRPGGGDGSMNIKTGVFTTVTSGYYIITFSGYVEVLPGDYTQMWLYHNALCRSRNGEVSTIIFPFLRENVTFTF